MIEEDGKEERATLAPTISAVPGRAQGKPDGLATGAFILEGTVRDGDCSFTFSLQEAIELDLKITGEPPGPYEIESSEGQTVRQTQRHSLCDQAIDMVFEWEVSLLVEDITFDDEGNYEKVEEGYEVHLHAGGRGVMPAPRPRPLVGAHCSAPLRGPGGSAQHESAPDECIQAAEARWRLNRPAGPPSMAERRETVAG